jgi:hypothetical protein
MCNIFTIGSNKNSYSNRIFFFTTASRTALGPTQLPIQWVPGALSLGIKRSGREADHSSPSSAEVKEWVELYLYSPNKPPWRGAQLKNYRDNFNRIRFYDKLRRVLNELCFWTLSIVWCLKKIEDLLQGFICVCTEVSCSVVSNWPLCEFCGRVYCDISSIFLIQFSWDTRRLIKSKSTIRSILTHHRQNPTEITPSMLTHQLNCVLMWDYIRT